jgi:hypothetical protein
MAGTHSQYPESLDIIDRFADGVGYPSADALNVLADAARQLQVTLGADPISGNYPAGSASDWASLTTVQAWLERFFRMEFGTFEIKLPLASTSASAWMTDYTVAYAHPDRFSHEFSGAANNIPHFIGVTFNQVSRGGSDDVQGAIAYQPMAHVNRYYDATTGEILGFTLRNNDPWGDDTYYDSVTITGQYWAFEPQYHS